MYQAPIGPISKKHKKEKRIIVKSKFVFNIKEILKLIKEVEAKILKRKLKKRQIIRALTPKIENKEEEGIKKSIYKSKSDCIIIASSRSGSK